MVSISDLKANPLNPNIHSDDQILLLARIIQHQGWRNPITVSKRSGLIVRGHGRLLAARMLDLKEVPVDYQDYDTEAAELADLNADNRLHELSGLDENMVRKLLKKIEKEDGFDLTL